MVNRITWRQPSNVEAVKSSYLMRKSAIFSPFFHEKGSIKIEGNANEKNGDFICIISGYMLSIKKHARKLTQAYTPAFFVCGPNAFHFQYVMNSMS